MRKVERLVNLVALLLDTHRPLTLDQVAELVPGYEASGESLRRMFERDKEELRGLGVPVERAPIDAWGTEEGYFIDRGAYGMPEVDLAPDERAALALAARACSGPTRSCTGAGPGTWSGTTSTGTPSGRSGSPASSPTSAGSGRAPAGRTTRSRRASTRAASSPPQASPGGRRSRWCEPASLPPGSPRCTAPSRS